MREGTIRPCPADMTGLTSIQAANKVRPLNLSAILQAGLDEILKKEGY
ncbi:hypothetical protein Mpsy_2450 [Methanolobus psychrophilus R15]|nr:hypothetical protein Mpsy_2450 [Methanolobus psychrophilus R15]